MGHNKWPRNTQIWVVRTYNWVCNHHTQIPSRISTLWCYIFSVSGFHAKNVGRNFITHYGNYNVHFGAKRFRPESFPLSLQNWVHVFVAYLHPCPCPTADAPPSCPKRAKSAQTAASVIAESAAPTSAEEILSTPSKSFKESLTNPSQMGPFSWAKTLPVLSSASVQKKLEKHLDSEDLSPRTHPPSQPRSPQPGPFLLPVSQRIIKTSL